MAQYQALQADAQALRDQLKAILAAALAGPSADTESQGMKLTEGFNLLATAPDGIKRLRELILSLAVQGKLVPQDPERRTGQRVAQENTRRERPADCRRRKSEKVQAAAGDWRRQELSRLRCRMGWEWVRFDAV